MCTLTFHIRNTPGLKSSHGNTFMLYPNYKPEDKEFIPDVFSGFIAHCFTMKVTHFCFRLMSLHLAHRCLSFFLSFPHSFLPTNFPSSFLPNRSHLLFSMTRPPREPSGLRYPCGCLRLPIFPPIWKA